MASEIESSDPHEMETSPEMLKNTPSNIRRLANEIELCEGRQKYLAQTRSPSDGGDVRWYFCKVPLGINELSASFPRTEIVGKGDYFRFCMRDSLAIEAIFLQREEELLSSWWREFAECNEGPKEQISSTSLSNEPSPSGTHEAWRSFTNEEERVGVPVKGGLYELDLLKRHCFPVYWYGENRRVLRGHWFALKGGLDWLPLREDVSEQLEYAYRGKVWRRRTFQLSGLFAARVDLQGSVPELHALFTGEDDTWEAWMSVQSSGFRDVVGFSTNSMKLRRGYAPPQSQKTTQDELRQQKEEEIDDYCSLVPVRHVVFMIHGIGQRLEKSNLVDDVGDFRHVTANIAERHLTSYQRGMQRILYIPCQWRKGLTFSGESAIETITLDGVRGLRRTLSATVHDVLYYMSPIFCQEIIDSVSNQLNRLYLKFLKRNPGYDGKISIYGHSLGSVLTYDILCHQEKLSSPFPMEWMFKEHKGVEALSSDNVLPGNPKSISVQKNENSRIGSADTPDPVEDHSETNHLSPPAPSESDESTSTNVCCSHADESILEVENQDYYASNSFNFEASTSDLCGSNSEKSELPSNKKNSINISGDGKDDVVESLRKEIDILKEKMREYEAKYADKAVQSRPDDSVKIHVPQIKYTKLLFKVDTFYAVGSPLGVFLSMRSVRVGIGKGKEYWNEESIHEEMPACKQMFNIFHPCDPVAYRIEPLVCKEFIRKRPVIIPYHRGGKRLYVGFQEFTEGWAARSQALKGHLISTRDKVLTICESKSGNKSSEIAESINDEEERSYGSLMMERVTGTINGRIDYSLQDKTFRHPYLSVLSAHTNYWRDPDTALFILNHLYRDIPEEPESLESSSDEESTSSSRRWSDPRRIDEEELPLTFSDMVSTKNFAFRAKKAMKKR